MHRQPQQQTAKEARYVQRMQGLYESFMTMM